MVCHCMNEVTIDVVSCGQTQAFIVRETTVNDARHILECFVICIICSSAINVIYMRFIYITGIP